MDLGLNHVIRKNIFPVDNSAHMLIQVPGDTGPSGIIVVCENFLVYKRIDHEDRKCFIPLRHDMNRKRNLFITCQATFLHDQFFFFIQSEFGDLYKVTLQYTEQLVHSMTVQFFDTVAPGTSINILKTGYLFVAAEASNHAIYMFKSTGDDEENPVVCVSQQTPEMEADPSLISQFNAREAVNLELRDELQNFAPINDMKVEDLTNEGAAQIYLACGRGAQGTIRALRHGLSVVEMAVSQMPGRPNSVQTLKGSLKDTVDKYMIVAFAESTLVLQIT